MKKYLNYWFIWGIVLFILGVILLLEKDTFCVADFFLSFVNFAMFYFENKKRGDKND